MSERRPRRSKQLAVGTAGAVRPAPPRGRAPSAAAMRRTEVVESAPVDVARWPSYLRTGIPAGNEPHKGARRFVDRERFLSAVQRDLEAMVDEEMAGTGWTGRDCPWIDHYLRWFSAAPAVTWERTTRLWMGVALHELSEAELRAAVVKRARTSVAAWRSSGRSPQPLPVAPAPRPLVPVNASGVPHTDLGEGEPLEPALRARFEGAIGAPLEHVRLHHDGAAETAARAQNARAFTLGPHVVMGAEWKPKSISGELLLAHELAHTLQQSPGRTGGTARDLEGDATRLALSAVGRLHGVPLAHPGPSASTGLRLQRCVRGPEGESQAGESDLRAGALLYRAPHMSAAEQPRAPQTSTAPDPALLTGEVQAGFSPIGDDWMLAVQSQDRLFLAPANRFVSEREPMAERAQPTDPARRPNLGAPAVGHGSLQLLNVGGGSAILLDAGGAGGRTRTILPSRLTALSASLGITRIDGVLLVHTHADHVRELLNLVRSGNIQGNRVWIWPGWESATRGPWAAVLRQLRDPSMTSRGFGPSWSPTTLPTATIGATGSELTTSTLRVGNTELSMVTRTEDLRAYVADLRAGGTGTRTADAASMLTRVRPGSGADTLIVGDLRGRTVGDIITQMNAGGTPFAEWVSNVRVVTGFHHLGNVETGADTAGYSQLLRMLPAGEPVTIIAQAQPNRVNSEFVGRLTASGFRVVVLPSADPNAIRQITVSRSGRIRTPGAQVYEPVGAAAEGNARLARLRAAAQVLRNPVVIEPLLATGSRREAERVAAALEVEARTLEEAVRSRRALELEGVHTGSRPADYATRAATLDAALRSVGTHERAVGEEGLTQLARVQPRVGELQRLLHEVASTGQSRPELRRLLEEVGPSGYREILDRSRIGELAPGVARERAIRASLAQLIRQRDLQRALQTGGAAGRFGRGVAGFMIFVELANAIGPYIARARAATRASRLQQLMSLVGAIGWWARLGLSVPIQARAGSRVLSPEAAGTAVVRRIWEETPVANRIDESELESSVRAAVPLDVLTLAPVAEWPTALFALLVERLATVMPTWNEYHHWLEDDPAAGMRAASDPATGSWHVLTGSVDFSASGAVSWEPSNTVTTLMHARVAAVRTGTTAWLRDVMPPTAARSSLDPQQPRMDAIERAQPPQAAQFRPGAARRAYGPYQHREVEDVHWNASPSFLAYPNVTAPSAKIWVTGSDEVTYRVIRGMRVYSYDPDAVVRIHKPTLWDRTYGEAAGAMPSWQNWAQTHGAPDERAAAALVRNGAPGAEWVEYPDTHRDYGTYYGEVRFPGERPNVSGMILVNRGDLILAERRR